MVRNMKRYLLLILTATFLMVQTLYAKSLDDLFLYSTAYIKNKSTNSAGTGFLVQRWVGDNKIVMYLISNKHVIYPAPLNKKNKDHSAVAEIDINTSEDDKIKKTSFVITLRNKSGKTYVKGHQNQNVDVAAIVISEQVEQPPGMFYAIPEDRFATKDFIKSYYISVGDRAIIIGYPLNLVEQGHVTPVARNAIIATKPDENFKNLPAFLVDGTVMRGSSGSPVILPVRPNVWTEKHKVDVFKIQQNHIIGIAKGHIKDWELTIRKTVALGKAQEFTIVDNSQLGLVFTADTILDVINSFKYKKWNKKKDK